MFLVKQIKVLRKVFVDFSSSDHDQTFLSISNLIARVVEFMKLNSEYKQKRMQMIDGLHLSDDHSFKLTKCVYDGEAKLFTAIYCTLNELSQVLV